MLSCLRIRAFAIIDELEVSFGSGLNVVTGETGAGKSILVDALELVLGGRGKPEMVRTGEDKAEVEALFDISGADAIRAALEEAGIEVDEDEVIVRRVVLASGRTRAYLNGRLTTQSQLKKLASGLADISSQHEHHTLVDARTHLGYLDAYGGLADEREAMAAAHRDAQAAYEVYAALDTDDRARAEREDLLRFQVQEIDELAPRQGEREELEAERRRLQHAAELARAAGGAEDALYASDDSLAGALGRIVQDVRRAAEVDAELAPHADQLDEALTSIEDAARALGQYAHGVELDPARLQEVDDRLDRYARLTRKYGDDADAMLAHRDEAETELRGLEDHESNLAAAKRTLDDALLAARAIAEGLRKKREGVAAELGKQISDELGSLGMGGARVEVAMAPLEGTGGLEVDGARLSKTGFDRAEFLIAPNRGEEARPLHKVASGGELSRALLAIKRVLSGLGAARLYVFDEVDTGVGGAIAEAIGKKLVDVAGHGQVLCITHLPQIAVFGDRHFHVEKRTVKGRTCSAIRSLAEDERVEEVARMLGGATIGDATRTAARELFDAARG